MEEQLIQRMDRLIAKVRELKSQNEAYAHQLNAWQTRYRVAEQELSQYKEQIEALQNNIKIIKLAQNIGGQHESDSTDVTELKRKVNDYIKQIDNCIELLNS